MKFLYMIHHWLQPITIHDQKQHLIFVSLSKLNVNNNSSTITDNTGNSATSSSKIDIHPNNNNKNNNKHLQWYHPVIVCCLYYIITISTSILLHDMIVPYFIVSTVNVNSSKYNNKNYIYNNENNTTTNTITTSNTYITYQTKLGLWFLFYALFILIWRLYYRKETYIINNDGNDSGNSTTTTSTSTNTYRYRTCRPQYPYIILYEYCWLCNVTLIIVSIGLFTNRMYLIISYLIIIGIDQILWYIDLVCYITYQYCPIGVATYVFKTNKDYTNNNNYYNNNKNNNKKDIKYIQHSHWSNRITWTHHLWTIPSILLFYIKNNHKNNMYNPIIHYVSYILSILYLLIHVLVSRYLIPSHIILPTINIVKTSQSIIQIQSSSKLQFNSQPIQIKHKSTTTRKTNNYNHTPEDNSIVATPSLPQQYEMYYLNINLSHEVYKDVQHISLLRIPNVVLLNSYQYTIALIWRWQCLNTIIYILYYWICN